MVRAQQFVQNFPSTRVITVFTVILLLQTIQHFPALAKEPATLRGILETGAHNTERNEF